MSARIGAWMTTLAAAAALSGCLARELSPLNPCAQQGTDQEVRINNVEKVDVLFMIDNSGSMEEEQRALREQLPRLVGVLASGDLEFGRTGEPGFGVPDFDAVRDLHVGVISSDMGTGGFRQSTCDESVFGDDGVLQNRGNQAMDPELDCLAVYDSRFLSFANPEGASCTPDASGNLPPACQQFADDFQCISALGTDGCGFEQQLEAILKALIPDSPDCTSSYCNFFMSQRGQGADPTTNAGFLREDSLLAILVLTDEEDCSALNLDLFNSDSSQFFGVLNLRCTTYTEALHPIERYVDGLLSLRTDPRLLVYSVIAGVPTQLVRDTQIRDADGNVIGQDFQAMLASNTLVPRPNSEGTALNPSCSSSNGEADPPRRFVQLARDLEARGAGAVVQSICQADYRDAIDAILQRIARNLGGTCLPRALNPDAAGRVNCNVLEVLPATGDVTRCEDVPAPDGVEDNGRRAIGNEGGREICQVTQVPATNREVRTDRAGWFYDDFTIGLSRDCPAEEQQRISYIPGSEPVTGTDVRLQCLQSVQNASQEGGTVSVDIGTPCEPYTAVECTGVAAPNFALNNICDPSSRSCQPRCESTADCANGYLCDGARLEIEDQSSPIFTARTGDTCPSGTLDPNTNQCVTCAAPYIARVADGTPASCARPCGNSSDCAYDGIATWGECLGGFCSLPRICVNPTCQG